MSPAQKQHKLISIGTTTGRNIGGGVSLQEVIDFGDNIHQETDTWTQPADEYGGASQGLLLNHRQGYKGLSCCHV